MEPNQALLHNWFYGNFYVRTVACVLTAGLMASIPTARLVTWFFTGLDRRLLSTARGLSPVFDVLKTFIPVVIATHGGGHGVGALAAVAAVGADCFCPWLRFRDGGGGRGAQLGALAGYYWPAAVAFATVWFVSAVATNYVAVGLLVAGLANILTLWIGGGPAGALAALAMLLLVAGAHRENLRRLSRATEPEMRAPELRSPAPGRPALVGRLSNQTV